MSLAIKWICVLFLFRKILSLPGMPVDAASQGFLEPTQALQKQ